MSQRTSEQPASRPPLESDTVCADSAGYNAEGPEHVLERILSHTEAKSELGASTAGKPVEGPFIQQGLTVGWIEGWDGVNGANGVNVLLLDGTKVRAQLLAGLERAVVEDALADRQLMLLSPSGAQLMVIGSICTRKPKTLKLEADHLELLGTKSVLLKAGRAALELRQDGNVELVGSRISAVSRGLFRIVGRMLRLN